MTATTTTTQNLHLDPQIALYVLLPITFIMLLVGLARHYLISWLDTPPKPLARRALREQRALMRGQLLRANGRHLSAAEFAARREVLMHEYRQGKYLSKKAAGASAEGQQSEEPPAAPPNPLDPAAMEGMIAMVKKQAVMFVPQSILMGWINLFFSGFVLTRLPFPLTLRFKSMLQRGVMTDDMDVTWVSSLSWYFLNLFGLNSIYSLILGGENSADQTKDMSGMSTAMPGAPQQDHQKLYNQERENLELVTPEDHRWVGDDVEERLLRRYQRH